MSTLVCPLVLSIFLCSLSVIFSLLKVNTLDALADGGEDLVGDGVEAVAQLGDGQVLAEDFDGVALAAVDVGDVDHADVHADIAHVGRPLAVDEAVGVAATQVAVEAVGIADGDGGDAAGPVEAVGATSRICRMVVRSVATVWSRRLP